MVYKAVSDAVRGTMPAGRDVAGETERAASAVAASTESYKGASPMCAVSPRSGHV